MKYWSVWYSSEPFCFFPFECNNQVLGNAKGAVAVVISIFIFRNPVTFVGIAGYSMTVLGVVAYGEAKRRFRWIIYLSNRLLFSFHRGISEVVRAKMILFIGTTVLYLWCFQSIITIIFDYVLNIEGKKFSGSFHIT